MDGGAVLTGRNGRGKTTLLQLVPIFYGENPTRIVGTETNRMDFNGYYLPHLTSYIVFEYLRRDVPCMVVLHASQQGGERRYRFVRSPYRPDLFLLDDGINILQVPDLRRHFKLKGIIHSEAISSVSEYRAIIQGKAGSGKARQRQRALAADYAFVGSGHHLTHIEKIVSGMFLRRTDFQDLQRMVVSCISDGDAEIALATERRKIASWPEHYGAYTRAMDEAGRMVEILDSEARLTAVEAELGRIHARVLRLLAHAEEADAENRRQRTKQAALAQQEEQAHRQTAEGIRIRLEGAGREAKEQESRIAALERQQEDYLRRDLPAKAELLLTEPALRDRLGQLNQRREALLGEQEKISLKYERLLNDLDRRHNQAERTSAEARTELSQRFEPRLKALEAEARSDLEGLRESHRAGREALETRLRETLERKGEFSQLVRAPQPDPELVEIRDAKRAAVETLDADRQGAEKEVREKQEVLAKAKDAHQEKEEKLQRLRARRDELEQRRQELLLQQSPGEESFLHFLRTSRPDWVFDIAKVVREDLLVRGDLNPELIDTLPTLYGVGLDLGHIEAHLAADEEGLRREISEIEVPECQGRPANGCRSSRAWRNATERARRRVRPWTSPMSSSSGSTPDSPRRARRPGRRNARSSRVSRRQRSRPGPGSPSLGRPRRRSRPRSRIWIDSTSRRSRPETTASRMTDAPSKPSAGKRLMPMRGSSQNAGRAKPRNGPASSPSGTGRSVPQAWTRKP